MINRRHDPKTFVTKSTLPPLEDDIDFTPPKKITDSIEKPRQMGVQLRQPQPAPPAPQDGKDAKGPSLRTPQPCRIPKRTSDTVQW